MAAKRKGRKAVRNNPSGKVTARKNGSLGYVVIGLGHIAQVAVLPGFAHAPNSRLVALVSGERKKRDALCKKYQARSYDYSELEECLASEDVDVAYIALPNDMHLEYVERCAAAGVHVLCEKPLGLSTVECERMIRACREADVKLMAAYRLHLEPANLKAIEFVKSGQLGEPRFFSSDFSFQVKDDNIRVTRERGGGPAWDIGIYCINAARYLFQSEPTRVTAFAARGKGDERFEEVDEAISVLMQFPNDCLATFTCSFGASATSTYRLVGTRGDLCMDPAYEYIGEKELTVTVDEKSRTQKFQQVDQFAAELEYFTECIQKNREPEPSGVEGMADVRIIEAIHESIETGGPVNLEPFAKRSRPSNAQRYRLPPVKSKPDMVDVESPHH
jgi:predicted dehydrogenase